MVIKISAPSLIFIKKIIKLFLGITLAISFGLFLFCAWVFIEPREFPTIANYISKEITETLPSDVKFSMQGVHLGFDTDYRLFLKLRDINVKGAKGTLELLNVNVFFDLLALLPQSHHNWLNIEVPSPKLTLQSNLQKDNAEFYPIFARVNTYLQEHKHHIVKFGLYVKDIELAFALNDETNIKLKVNSIRLKPSIIKEKLLFDINGDFNIGGRNNVLTANLDTSSNQHLKINGLVNNISHLTLKAFGINLPELESSSIEGDLKFSVQLSNLSNIEHASFEISNFAGNIKQNDFFPKDLNPKELLIRGNCKKNCSLLQLEQVKVVDEVINFEGNFLIDMQESPTLSGSFKLYDLPINNVKDYWPIPATPRTREWIFSHISEGKIQHAVGNVNLNLEEVLKKKNIKKDDIDLTLYLEDTTIVYADKVPVIYDVDAVIQINGEEVKFSIPEARILSSKIKNLKGYIPELGTSNSRVEVETEIDGSIQDVIDIGFGHTDYENHLYKNLYGNAITQVNVSVPLDDRDIDLDIIKLDVKSDISNIKINKIIRNLDVTGGKLQAKYLDKAAYINGTVKVNDTISADIDVKQSFDSPDRNIKIKFSDTWDNLIKLGFEKPNMIEGAFKQDIEIDESKNITRNTVFIDLTDSLVEYKNLSYEKKSGELASLKMEFVGDVNDNEQPIVIDNYTLQMPNLFSQGKATLDSSFSQINSITSTLTKLDKTNIQFEYKESSGVKAINVSGKSLDLSKIDFLNAKSTKSSSTNKSIDGLILTSKVSELFLKNDVKILTPEIYVNCEKDPCDKIRFKGNFNSLDKFDINLTYPELSVYSNNAGLLLKAFDILDEVEVGTLNIKSKNDGNKWNGMVGIKDFKTKQIPILAKVLSIASITLTDFESIGSILSGSGIKFKSFDCPHEYTKGIISFKECASLGRSMAISFNGKVDLNNKKVDIDGVLVPQNIINVILRNIPIVNQLFGTKAQEGAIGVNFKIEGDIDDPKVLSNPLSILAPGFLKKIFETNTK